MRLLANLPCLALSVDIQAVNSRRAWVIDQFGSLIRNGKIPKEDGWVFAILNWLVVQGLFIVKKKSSKSSIIPVSFLLHSNHAAG